MGTTIFIIILSLITSAFFSGLEAAFLSLNKLKVEVEAQKGKMSAYIISFFLRYSNMFITTLIIGNKIALIIYALLTTQLLSPILHQAISAEELILLIQIIIASVIYTYTADFLPRDIFRLHAHTTLKIFCIPAFIVFILLFPISVLVTVLLRIFLSLSNIKKEDYKNLKTLGKIDLIHFLSYNANTKTDEQDSNNLKILLNALEFSSVKLRECIQPRTELITSDINEPIEHTIPLFVESGYSKILIYSETIDNIIGYIHSSDILKNPKSIKEILRDIPCVPETMSARKMLSQFITEQQSIAVVVDEFGGTAGIVTVEDIIEEIFGEIRDEHDHEELTEREISNTEFVFSGRHKIDYVNENYNLHIAESDEYETIAGFFLNNHENFPEVNSSIIIENLKLSILKITGTRIDLIHVKILEDTD
ncbi:MAG: hemolysin family protein [Bacteroidales bacterium]